jgi:hypothetical protein
MPCKFFSFAFLRFREVTTLQQHGAKLQLISMVGNVALTEKQLPTNEFVYPLFSGDRNGESPDSEALCKSFLCWVNRFIFNYSNNI